MTLKEAIATNKLDQFIKEHEQDPVGDADVFDAILSEVIKPQKKKSTQKTSSQVLDDDSNDTQTPLSKPEDT